MAFQGLFFYFTDNSVKPQCTVKAKDASVGGKGRKHRSQAENQNAWIFFTFLALSLVKQRVTWHIGGISLVSFTSARKNWNLWICLLAQYFFLVRLCTRPWGIFPSHWSPFGWIYLHGKRGQPQHQFKASMQVSNKFNPFLKHVNHFWLDEKNQILASRSETNDSST